MTRQLESMCTRAALRRASALLSALVIVLASTSVVHAEEAATFEADASDAKAAAGTDYRIDRYTIDGGGGASTGGAFSISGTIGQPDADPLGPSTGGIYAISGGFWSAAPRDLGDAMFANGFEAP